MKNLFSLVFISFFANLTISQTYCLPPSAVSELNINNIRAITLNGSTNHNNANFGTAGYGILEDTTTVIFASAFWIGGLEGAGNLHLSTETFSTESFSPGPLKLDGTTSDTVCSQFDRVWKLNKWEVKLFRDWYAGTVVSPYYVIPEAISTYPAHGNTASGYAANLAPFHDENSDGLYDPQDGDYPEFDLDGTIGCGDKLYGDQCVYWIMNDLGLDETAPAQSMNVEIQCQAYAYVGSESINNTSFLRYKVINRSSNNYHDVYTGHWFDADLGCSEDDFVECDVARGLGITWNGDNDDNDGCNGAKPYGLNPPAIGFDVVKGPVADLSDGIDNNYNGSVDELNEVHSINRFMSFNRSAPSLFPTNNPVFAIDYYNYMSGKWLDGTDWLYGGTGHFGDPSATSVVTTHVFPEYTDTTNWFSTNGIDPGIGGWNEITEGNPKGDRRMMGTSGPFNFNSGDEVITTIAIIWARDYTGDNFDSKEKLKLASDTIQDFCDSCMVLPCTQLYANFSYQQNGLEFIFSPLQSADSYTWDFGDGNSSSDQFGVNQYTSTGTMTVCLTATNACSSINVCKEVFVDPIWLNLYAFPVQRIEGQGNGGWELEIQDSCIANFELSGGNYIDQPVYKPGKSPVLVEYIDPTMIQPGAYGFKMDAGDTTANWKMYLIGGIDTVYSDVSIGLYNRQLIPQWGVAVTIKGTSYSQPFSSAIYSPPISSKLIYDDPAQDWLDFIVDEDIAAPSNWIKSGTVQINCDAVTHPDITLDPCMQGDYVGYDDLESYEHLLDGGISPYKLVSKRTLNAIIGENYQSTPVFGLQRLNSIDLVLTADTSLWSRSVVIETQDSTSNSIGGAIKQEHRLGNSVDKNGISDGTGTGMGWFPGYALNVETGERLNIAFGEDSGQPGANGADMIWNPTDVKSDGSGNLVWGGKHQIFVFANYQSYSNNGVPMYDNGSYFESDLVNGSSGQKQWVWRSCMYVVNPILKPGHSILETETRLRIRVSKPYADYGWTLGDTINNIHPLYNVFIDTASIVNGINVINDFQTSVFPNPTSDQVTVSFNNEANEEIRLIMVDLNGKIVITKKGRSASFLLDSAGLESGTYIVYLTNENGSKISSSKVVKLN
ncbi:MAG: hypothetical protein ACI9J3_001429 [Parvicellaceae bacterium]|jgi:hypothetical protein